METAKEELQSTNEELTTINEELQTRNAELAQSRDFSRSIVETVRNPLLVLDEEMRISTANQAFYEFFNSAPGSVEGKTLFYLESGQWDVPELRVVLSEVLPRNKNFQDFEFDRVFPNIGRKIMLLSGRRIDGVQMILLSINDITARRSAEQELRRSEAHLRQAQKMEAIGRLAGGVAHDFNNLLTGILGYSQLLLDETDSGDSKKESLDEIKKCAERAASLTQQLLAFGRRQLVQPKVLSLNAVVADLERILRRLIGENIELEMLWDESLGYVAPTQDKSVKS